MANVASASRLTLGILLAVLALESACSSTEFDSFEPWEAAQASYLLNLPEQYRSQFPNDYYAIAYSLATGCFEELEPLTGRDQAVKEACRDDGGQLLSAVMSLDDFCEQVRADREAGAALQSDQFCRD